MPTPDPLAAALATLARCRADLDALDLRALGAARARIQARLSTA